MPKVYGIAAPTCAGKTTLLEEVGRRMPETAVLSFDEYDLYPSGSEAMARELVERRITNWEDPALFDMETFVRHLGQIASGEAVHLHTRSRESMERGETERIFTPAPLNIVEGIFVLHDSRARAILDLTVYVDIPLDVIVERRLKRSEGGTNPWDDPDYIRGPMIEGTKRYVLPQREYADVVLDGMRPTSELADEFIERVNQP